MYREGMFYKCYNEDAMLFSQRVRDFKISAKYIKSAGSMVLSLGFPVTLVEQGTITIEKVSDLMDAASWKEEPNRLVFQLANDIKQDYDAFAETFTSQNANPGTPQHQTETKDHQKLIEMIRNYDLANHTPMQGMAFIQELKRLIQNQGA